MAAREWESCSWGQLPRRSFARQLVPYWRSGRRLPVGLNRSFRWEGFRSAEMVKELQQGRDRLDQAIGALAPLAGISKTSSARGGAGGPRRTLSAAARRKVSLAQKARWAKLRSENSAKGQSNALNPGKRLMSAAGLARIRAANKARWAKWRAQQKKAA
jgi:hypothetical protein